MPKPLIDSSPWKEAIKTSADPKRAAAFLDKLATSKRDELTSATPERARILAVLFSGSVAVSETLIKHPDWLDLLDPDLLRHARREQGLRREVEEWLGPALKTRDYSGALTRLRLFHQRELMRLAARDLARLAGTIEITLELSNLADVCLSAVLRLCEQQQIERLGRPYHQGARGEWLPSKFAVLGLGKLGGQELNYNSDVDLTFVYSEEGFVFKEPPDKKSSTERARANHQYFKRLSEAFVAEVTRATAEGALYRVDLRLRPEGDAGPWVRSLPSYEAFYSQWGQTWERMMLMKARGVAGDPALANEFLEMVQPFRYPRSLPAGALREIAAMKQRMESEVVKSGELDRNVKLGRGGIREIEFIVQSTQLVHGGRMPFLQQRQTVPALEKMVQYKLIEPKDAEALRLAYCFLRDVEHRLQMENNLQTHTIPADRTARLRLARLMEFSRLDQFERAYHQHASKVRSVYSEFLPLDQSRPASTLPQRFDGEENAWKKILTEHGFKNVEQSLRLLKEFAQGPGYVHVSKRTTQLAWQIIPKILQLCPRSRRGDEAKASQSKILSDPDRVLARLDSFISAYGARSVMFETWNSNPSLFELLLLLFDRSEFLAEMAIRTPDLVDELVLSGRLRRSKTAAQILEDLRHGLNDRDQRLWIRRYHQTEFMRIGLRDILGLADAEQNLTELSALADACLQYALDVALRKEKLKSSPIAIIGLGKLGGQELNYGSDLDILFVAEDSTKDLPKFQRLAAYFMDLLSSQTEFGMAFAIDARLRPDGEKGLLVNTLSAYDEYYRHRAQLWEIQALTRTRPVAGNSALGERFRVLAGVLTNFTPINVPNDFALPAAKSKVGGSPRKQKPVPANRGLAASTPDWKQQIAHMRERIERERTPPGQSPLAIKTGAGGLIDAEFIAQTFCLEHGWLEANTLRALEKARSTGALPEREAHKLIENFRQLRRIERILRRWSFEGEAVLPSDPAAFYRVSIRCGFKTPDEFRDAVARYRKAIREVYSKVFSLRRD